MRPVSSTATPAGAPKPSARTVVDPVDRLTETRLVPLVTRRLTGRNRAGRRPGVRRGAAAAATPRTGRLMRLRDVAMSRSFYDRAGAVIPVVGLAVLVVEEERDRGPADTPAGALAGQRGPSGGSSAAICSGV